MSVYDTSTLGVADNLLTFNGTSFPIFRVVSRAPQARQIREQDIPTPFEGGITDFQTLIGSMAYVIEGVMYPGSETDYYNGLAALRKVASLDIAQADNLADNGYVPYVFKEGSTNKQVFMKALYMDAPETTRKGLVQPFRIFCKIKDPVIFSTTVLTATTQGSNPTNNGGTALFPFGYPVLWGASIYSTSSVATNGGDLDGYPISIKVYGPINNPTITNSTTGQSFTFNTNVMAGQILTVAYDKDSLSADVNGVSVLNTEVSTNNYFKLKANSGNNITLNGSAFSSGAYVEVRYYAGYWPLS